MTQLPLQSNIVLNHQYFLGSFRDESRFQNHGSPTGTYWNKRPDTHLKFSGSDLITVADSPELQLTEGTLIVYGDFDKYTSNDRLVSKWDTGGVNYDFYFGAATLNLYDGVNARYASTNWVGSKFVALSFVSGEAAKAYINGAFVLNFSGVSTITVNDAPLKIGNIYAGGNPLANPIKGVIIYNTALTDSQIAQAYEYTLETTSPSFKKKGWFVPSQITGREDGLVAGYDMENIGQKIVDKTGNGNDGTINSGIRQTKLLGLNAFEFDSNSKAISLTETTYSLDAFSVSFLYKANDTSSNATIIGKSVGAGTNHLLFTGTSTNLVLETNTNGDLATGLWSNDTNWHHYAVTANNKTIAFYLDGADTTVDGTVTDADFIIGQIGFRGAASDPPNGRLAELRFYNKALTQSNVNSLYKQYATLPYFVDDLSDANESVSPETEFLSNTNWRINSGSFSIARDETNKPREKVIRCDTSGLIYQESSQAYGTFEFDWYKEIEGSNTYLLFMADVIGAENATGQDGYNIWLTSANQVALRESTNGTPSSKMFTGVSYIEADTWYRYRITRRYDGDFTTYIKGGIYTDWTLVDTTGGSQTNPVTDNTTTTSKYLILDLDASDMVSDFRFYPGVLT